MISNDIRFPLFLINFKSYEEVLGDSSIRLAASAEKIAKEEDVEIAVAPLHTEIREISKFIKTFAQSADPINPGSYTGHIPLEAIKLAGAKGVIINHSEKRLDLESIKFLVEKCRKLSLFSLVCGVSARECYELAKFNPDAIAIEPPELIGTGRSVSKYKPESVSQTVKLVKSLNSSIRVLCGAGISNGEDVIEALKLGAEGILVSSSIVKAKNPEDKIKEMALALKKFFQ